MSLQAMVDFVEEMMCGKTRDGDDAHRCVRIKGHAAPCRDNTGEEFDPPLPGGNGNG